MGRREPDEGVVVMGSTRRTRHGEPEIRPYDFRRPTKLSRDHLRILDLSLDTFARQWTTLLTTSLRAVSTVQLSSVQQLTYDEYVSGLPEQTCMLLLSVEPLSGAGALELPIDHAMTMVDHLLGGSGTGAQPDRPLTEIELSLVRGVADRILKELRYSLEEWLPLAPEIVAVEFQPQFAQAAGPGDLVLVLTFELQINAHESVATLALPFNGVFPSLEKAVAAASIVRDRSDREAASRLVNARLTNAPVDVSVQFTPTLVRVADVVALRPGDVLTLAHAVARPLAVVADGITFAHAVPGSEGRRLACMVVESPEESD